MKSISNFLILIGKSVLMTLGTVVTAGCFIGGLYCVSKADENKAAIDNALSSTNGALTNIQTNLNNASNSINSNIDQFKEQAFTVLGQVENELSTQINNLTILEEQLANDTTGTIAIVSEMRTTFTQLNNEIVAIHNKMQIAINTDEIKNLITQANTLAQTYIGSVNQALETVTPEKISYYYDTISESLLIIGGVLLGLIVVGSVLSFVFYKKVDGKLVNRFRAKKEVEIHLRKILKKYPRVVDMLRERQ